MTHDSTLDNLRPIVPQTAGRDELLLWLRGSYRAYTDYALEAVGLLPRQVVGIGQGPDPHPR